MIGAASELVLSVFLVVLLTGTALVANGCIFAAYCRNTNLRTVDNYLFMFLSSANVVVGLCYPLQCLVDLGILNYRAACLPLACVLLVVGFLIAWTIVGLTVERYLNILHPFAARTILTEKRVLCIVCFILFYAAVTGAVVPLVITSAKSNISPEVAANGTASGLNECRLANLVPSRNYRYFYLANRVVAIPLFFGIYLRIFLVARRHVRAIGVQVPAPASQDGPSNYQNGTGNAAGGTGNTQRPERHSKAGWRRQIRLTLLVFAIALYQSICWIPQTLLLIQHQSPPSIYYTLTHFVTFSTSATYPIIYGLGNRDFRKALTNLFGCSNRLNRPRGGEMVSMSPEGRGGSRRTVCTIPDNGEP
ncbi:adenosine receptor A2b-like [Patiria miniata]|uniref:G-protein coupled receptors family 1 profile domain-containing protein n=1 Tax=Patiria miniata TaxID=46514 RepID=A0A913Z4U1_PATMI|nr:adenosine receptor A2b-like [Patiria miniata]